MSDLLGGFFHSEYYQSSESVFITLTKENIGKAHICCAFSDKNGKDGLVTVVGTKKFHFMSDAKWLLRQGFVACEELSSGFSLFYRGRFITTDISVYGKPVYKISWRMIVKIPQNACSMTIKVIFVHEMYLKR